jgi:hypothetical protein
MLRLSLRHCTQEGSPQLAVGSLFRGRSMLGRINWHPTAREIKYFSVTMLIAFALANLVLVLGGKYHIAGWFFGCGFVLSVICYFIPPVGKAVYYVWMAATYILGRIVSPVVTAIIFYLLVTPIALVNRLMGKDQLRLKKPKGASSYFIEHTDAQDVESMRRQF